MKLSIDNEASEPMTSYCCCFYDSLFLLYITARLRIHSSTFFRQKYTWNFCCHYVCSHRCKRPLSLYLWTISIIKFLKLFFNFICTEVESCEQFSVRSRAIQYTYLARMEIDEGMGLIRWLTGLLLILECHSRSLDLTAAFSRSGKSRKSRGVCRGWIVTVVHVTDKMSLESVRLK